jgi:hypothetical protein
VARIVLPASKRLPSNSSYSPETSSVASPATQATHVVKHAEQFAMTSTIVKNWHLTYWTLCTRTPITKKPYVEKPEQGEDESDEEASIKAWQLHLQREDSSVLEHFYQKSSTVFRRRLQTRVNFRSLYVSICPYSWSIGKNAASGVCTSGPYATSKSVSITISKTAAMLSC